MVKKYKKQVDEKRRVAQTSKECNVSGCDKGGRTIGHLGTIELNYCGKHRKYGERVLNFMIRAIFGEKLREFLKESKDDLFMKNFPKLSDESYEKLEQYVADNIQKLDGVDMWHKKMK